MYNAGNETLISRKFETSRCLAIFTQHRPGVFPLYRNEIGNSAHSTVITKKVGVPVAIGHVDQATLRHTLILQGNPAFPWASDIIGTVYQYRSHSSTWPHNIEQVVFAINFKKLRAFCSEHNIVTCWCTGIFNYYSFCSWFHIREVIF